MRHPYLALCYDVAGNFRTNPNSQCMREDPDRQYDANRLSRRQQQTRNNIQMFYDIFGNMLRFLLGRYDRPRFHRLRAPNLGHDRGGPNQIQIHEHVLRLHEHGMFHIGRVVEGGSEFHPGIKRMLHCLQTSFWR